MRGGAPAGESRGRDRIFREHVLWRAWLEVRANQAAPGIDAITIADIEGRHPYGAGCAVSAAG